MKDQAYRAGLKKSNPYAFDVWVILTNFISEFAKWTLDFYFFQVNYQSLGVAKRELAKLNWFIGLYGQACVFGCRPNAN